MNRQERLAQLKEQLIQKEIENRKKDKEYYEKITSGPWWTLYKAGMIFSIVFMLITTVDTFVSRERAALSEEEYVFDRSYYKIGYQSIWVDGSIFFPPFRELEGFVRESFEVENSLILNKPKVLYFDSVPHNETQKVARTAVVEYKSIFPWFPFLQFAMLIPFFIFYFRKPKSWFIFARGMAMLAIYPCLIILFIYQLV